MLIVYLGKTFVPIQLSTYPSLEGSSLVPGLIVGAFLAVGLFWVRGQLLGRAGVGLLWYAAFLAPTLFSSPITSGLEHRLCVPLIGLLITAAEILPAPIRRLPRALTWGVAVAILAALATTTVRRLRPSQ